MTALTKSPAKKWARAALIALLPAAAAIFHPGAARAEVITLACTGDVTGMFTIDLSGGSVVTYDENNKSVDLTELEVTETDISFEQDEVAPKDPSIVTGSSSTRFHIDRQTDKIDKETYQYLDGKIVGKERASGPCKRVPNPHSPL